MIEIWQMKGLRAQGQGFSLKCVEFGMKKLKKPKGFFYLKFLDFHSLKVHTRHESCS